MNESMASLVGTGLLLGARGAAGAKPGGCGHDMAIGFALADGATGPRPSPMMTSSFLFQ